MRSLLPFLSFASVALGACGGRSDLAVGGTSGGTGGATSTTTITSSTATGGSLGACTAWQLVSPVVALPTPAPAVRAAEVSLASDNDEDVYVTVIEAPAAAPGVLRSGRLRAFAMWPPDFVGMVEAAPNVLEYVTGPGPGGPVGLIDPGNGQLELAMSLLPQVVSMGQETPGNVPVFVTGIADRWLFGASQTLTSYTRLDVGSYQTSSLEQSEVPAVCIASAVLGAAVPAGQGFIGLHALPNPPDDACDVMAPQPGTIATFFRYDAPTEPGTFLTSTESDHLVFPEALTQLLLVPISTGAWGLTQTDGSTSDQQPPLLATRVDQNGHIGTVGLQTIPVTPDGVVTGAVAATALGDGLVVAWAETLDPSAPTIGVRTVNPDGSLGAITRFATSPAFLQGRLRVLASRSRRSLVLTWDGNTTGPGVGVARLDCAPGG